MTVNMTNKEIIILAVIALIVIVAQKTRKWSFFMPIVFPYHFYRYIRIDLTKE